MSHELREPMNGVLGMARLLGETALTSEQRELLDSIVGSAEALLTVLNDLLDLSRVEAGRLELRESAFDPRMLLERAIGPFLPKAAAKGLQLTLEVAADVPSRLSGDPGRLRQVLVNLIGNAVKFTDAGSVRVEVRYAGTDARRVLLVEVEDTGPGIGPADAARLFQSFRQAEAGTARMFGGSGLGLAISHRLIHAMGGSLRVSPTGGQGTCFVVELPALPASGPLAQHEPVSLAGLNLLVIEPLPGLRRLLCRTVADWGMVARGAAGAEDALREIQEAATRSIFFDFVVMSAVVADEQVGALIDVLRRGSGKSVRIVCMAASGLRGDAARAVSLGFDAYLAAPFKMEELMQLLIQMLQAQVDATFLTRHDLADSQGRPLHILVADDNPVNCRLAQIILQKAGHRVRTVADGAAAVRAVAAGGFDLVLMDVQMPGMDGLAATRSIRHLGQADLRQIPIVALTAEAMPGDERRVRDAGMDGYLTKPIDRPKLLSTIRFWAG